MNKKIHKLEQFSHNFAKWAGTTWAFLCAVGITLIWLASGPFFKYSNAWQTTLNTFTSIATFLMLFLVQRSQNKQSLAIQVKLNELILTKKEANNDLIKIEEASEEVVLAAHASHQSHLAIDDGIVELHQAKKSDA